MSASSSSCGSSSSISSIRGSTSSSLFAPTRKVPLNQRGGSKSTAQPPAPPPGPVPPRIPIPSYPVGPPRNPGSASLTSTSNAAYSSNRIGQRLAKAELNHSTSKRPVPDASVSEFMSRLAARPKSPSADEEIPQVLVCMWFEYVYIFYV